MTPAPETGRTAEDTLVERLRSWGENDPDETYFQGDALACLLIDCGKASEVIDQLRSRLLDAEKGAEAMRDALDQAEACLSIVEPRSDKAEYLRTLDVVRAALNPNQSTSPHSSKSEV